jgi:hypothetical protein
LGDIVGSLSLTRLLRTSGFRAKGLAEPGRGGTHVVFPTREGLR